MPELLDDSAITSAVAGLAWERSGGELVKVVRLEGFRQALDWVNRVGELAEEANHHPDIDIRWNTVTLRLSTHSVGGITSSDIALASGIDALATA